ncbi:MULTISPECIES: response regulator transcription factor [Caproicibacterium]|uniref:Stage 0 sporulation protein A homolog n=1 Tax=Caproicibacterium argilliputei TaxID=3030016 RepID=A0AA97DB98_9FIRM|nr:response regulator [Caproicibacterium argilliputei]WOC32453.1 response regulator [Caproicibacterium argilliputei]
MDGCCKVLVVEDEYLTRRGIRNMVDWESNGFEIVGEATNGAEALEQLEKCHPNIVLTDIIMPVMDGRELEKEICRRYPEVRVVVLSSYSDFDYVHDSFQSGAVDYILKPTLNPENLLMVMKKAAAGISGISHHGACDLSLAVCAEKYLSGFSDEHNRETLEKVFTRPCFIMMGMDRARLFGRGTESLEYQSGLLTLQVNALLADIPYVQLVLEESLLLLIVNFSAEQEDFVRKSLRCCAEQIARKEPRTFYICTSTVSTLSALKQLLSGSFQQKADSFFYYKGQHFMEPQDFYLAAPAEKFNMDSYMWYLGSLQVTEALEMLEDYVGKVLKERSLGEMELKALVQNAWYPILSMLEDQGLDPAALTNLKRDCLNRIYACSYCEDFTDMFAVVQSDFKAIVGRYEINAGDSISRKILQYINGHYNEPLTLADLAQRFNFNYTYLSSYFHTHYQERFSEYLNRERVRHASELLRQGKLSVADVCTEVGYADQSYFTRVFKKMTGIPPGEYRKRCKQGGRNEEEE